MSARQNRALVGNAGDPDQVRKAGAREKRIRQRELADLRAVTGTIEGRRALWRLLEQARVFSSVFDSDALRMSYLAGRQDFGHYLMAEVTEADAAAWLLMQQEAAQLEQVEAPEDQTEKDSTEETDA